MPKNIALPWATGGNLELAPAPAKEPAAKNKIKYTCPGCEANVWGKPDLNVKCGDCDDVFEAAI
jgi:hypothetical protein